MVVNKGGDRNDPQGVDDMGALRKPGAEASRRPRRRRSRGVRLPSASTNEATRRFILAYATREMEWGDWIAVLQMLYGAGLTWQARQHQEAQVILWPGLLDCE